jgi:signal transduction histidine kinase
MGVKGGRGADPLQTSDETEKDENRYRLLYENMDEGFMVLDLIRDEGGEVIDATILDANPGWALQSGYDIRPCLGMRISAIMPQIGKDVLDTYGWVEATGNRERREWCDQEAGRHYEGHLFRFGNGKVGVLSRDITDRKTTEDALRGYARELKRSNDELQQFAYIASHDLQEPLRMVTSYLVLLDKKFNKELSPQAGECIHFAIDGASRMKELIDDLLQYSRIESKPAGFTDVDMNKVAKIVIRDLNVAIDEVGAEVLIDPLPIVHANDMQMNQVLTNIVSNAIKFNRQKSPKVEVSAVTYNSEFVFAVKDNGIGIDPKHADRLFNMFQRLHTRDEYKGTGMGLAIARKIVERHGGRIWFESEPGKGSTFYFTIPLSHA